MTIIAVAIMPATSATPARTIIVVSDAFALAELLDVLLRDAELHGS